jgi:hypothetical protein
MSYVAYKLVHLFGLFALFVALAGMAGHAAAGHPKADNRSHRALLVLHGAGALIALTGGFGLMARTGIMHGARFPGWIWAKLLLWLLLGGMIALPYRNRPMAKVLLLGLPVLGLLGAYLASYKPF